MGHWMVNINIKYPDCDTVEGIGKKIYNEIIVLKSGKNWSTVFCKDNREIDCHKLHTELANEITRKLKCVGIIIAEFDSHVFMYAISKCGKIVDIYESGFKTDMTIYGNKPLDIKFHPFNGNEEILMEICDNYDKEIGRWILSKEILLDGKDGWGGFAYVYFENGKYKELKKTPEKYHNTFGGLENERLMDLTNILGCDEFKIDECEETSISFLSYNDIKYYYTGKHEGIKECYKKILSKLDFEL